jgi:acetyl esterase/lipase
VPLWRLAPIDPSQPFEAYARKLDQAGVDVIATRYNGLIHDYGLLNAISRVPAVRSALLQASEELKKWLR